MKEVQISTSTFPTLQQSPNMNEIRLPGLNILYLTTKLYPDYILQMLRMEIMVNTELFELLLALIIFSLV